MTTLAEHFARIDELARPSEYLDPALRRMMVDHVLNSAMLFGPMLGWDPVELAERVKAVRARLSPPPLPKVIVLKERVRQRQLARARREGKA
jgi:hypothetical protein